MSDTCDTVSETVKRFADNRVAAISTYTPEATEAAMRAAEGSETRIWRVAWLSDSGGPVTRQRFVPPHGIICPVGAVGEHIGIDTICPGIRRPHDEYNGHVNVATPLAAVRAGATFAVVGRPIWATPDPVAAAKEFHAVLSGVRGYGE